MSQKYTIPATAWEEYRDKLKEIDDKAAELMQKYAEAHNFQIDEEMVEYAFSVSQKYGEASGALAANMYDSIAEYWMNANNQKKIIKAADVAEPATRKEVADTLYSAKAQNLINDIPARVARLVKQVGADTMVKNAIRDHAQWAWIPGGNETCAFCMTLASNGWTDASKKVLKGDHADHIHNNCQCTFAIRFDDSMDVEGYNPRVYQRIYDRNNGDINAMRRELYPQIREERNARRRELYAENKDKNGE